MTYRPEFDLDLRHGLTAERSVWRVLNMNACKIEVKADRRYVETGNVFIEVAQRPRGADSYKPSGIHVSEAEYWAFSSGQAFTLIPRVVIANLVAEQTRPPIDGGKTGDNPTKGYPIPLRHLIALSTQDPGSTTR